jgi:CheY-like chemotaxis protein
MVAVTDEGTGMSKEVLARAFEPFFTTKEVGKGSGLGLSQVLGFAKQSGGGVRIHTRVGEGTTIRIYVPRAAKPAIEGAAARGPSTVGRPMPFRASILLVDDDNAVREVIASMLRELDYVVLEVGSGGATLDLLEQNPKIDLAILDFAMPGMNGMDLARQIQAKMPAVPFLFVSGYADVSVLGDVREEQVVRKPFVRGELAEKVLALLNTPQRQGLAKVVRLKQ